MLEESGEEKPQPARFEEIKSMNKIWIATITLIFDPLLHLPVFRCT